MGEIEHRAGYPRQSYFPCPTRSAGSFHGAGTTGSLGNIKIIPSLPNPNSGKTYRLQVGAFSVADSAAKTMQQLRALGLNAAQEQHGSLLRVSAVGVRAADVYSAVQKLEAAGFKEVWIRE